MENFNRKVAHIHLSPGIKPCDVSVSAVSEKAKSHFEFPKSDRIIGIDFGTTGCVCSVWRDDTATIIPNRLGNPVTPTAIYIEESGSALIGKLALQAALRDPEHAVLQVKRLLGTNLVLNAYGHVYSVQELAARILFILLEDCQNALKEQVNRAVVTVPASFTETELNDVRIACTLANISIVRLVPESVAVCLSMPISYASSSIVAVLDLGGGSFDVSLTEIHRFDGEYNFEVLSIAGENDLGGSDYDEEIVAHCIRRFEAQTSIDLSNDVVALMRLREAAESTRIELSALERAAVHVPFIYADASGSYDLLVSLTREEFEKLTEQLTDRLLDCCDRAIQEAQRRYGSRTVSTLFLVGQASRTPSIRYQAQLKFGVEADRRVDTNYAVALGAAREAGDLNGHVKNSLALYVTAHDLGIRLSNGKFYSLIEKNTTFPTKAQEDFATTIDWQTHAIVEVVQREARESGREVLLSRFVFGELTPGPVRSVKVQLTFDIDPNNRLTVIFKDLQSARTSERSINYPVMEMEQPSTGALAGGLSRIDDLQDAIKN